jgi:acyl carrier protein
MSTNTLNLNSETDRSKLYTVDEIQNWLIEQLAERLEIDPEEIDIDEPFDNYNLDSGKALILLGRLEKWLGQEFNPVLIFNYPTVAQLAERLASEIPS